MSLEQFLVDNGYSTLWELNVNPECEKFINTLFRNTADVHISPFEYRHLIKLTKDSALIEALKQYDENNIESGFCEGCSL